MTSILQLDRLRFGYAAQPVLHDIDLHLPRGEFVALIGPNGSGKSTLLQCVAGIQVPQAGRITIDGIDLAGDPQAAKSRLGYAIDPGRLPPLLTGREALRLFAGARGWRACPRRAWHWPSRCSWHRCSTAASASIRSAPARSSASCSG